jgi:hypothetical protein
MIANGGGSRASRSPRRQARRRQVQHEGRHATLHALRARRHHSRRADRAARAAALALGHGTAKALHWAVYRRQPPRVLELMLEHSDVNARNVLADTPLSCIPATHEHHRLFMRPRRASFTIEISWRARASFCKPGRNGRGQSAVHRAVETGALSCALEMRGVDAFADAA